MAKNSLGDHFVLTRWPGPASNSPLETLIGILYLDASWPSPFDRFLAIRTKRPHRNNQTKVLEILLVSGLDDRRSRVEGKPQREEVAGRLRYTLVQLFFCVVGWINHVDEIVRSDSGVKKCGTPAILIAERFCVIP
jgi:hypothetical protein